MYKCIEKNLETDEVVNSWCGGEKVTNLDCPVGCEVTTTTTSAATTATAGSIGSISTRLSARSEGNL